MNDGIIAGAVANGVYFIVCREDIKRHTGRCEGLPDNHIWNIVFTGDCIIGGTKYMVFQ